VAVCLLSLCPFVIFCVAGIPQIQPHRWLQAPPGGIKGVDWALLLNTFFWNINFWESAACFAGEVRDPSRDYPRGMLLAVLMVLLVLLLPILVATGASSAPHTEWRDGYFVVLAGEIVGPWLGVWMILASALSNVGMFEAEMSSDSWQVAGMADRGILPAVLSHRSKHGTPTYGILLSATGVLCLGWMSFGQVVSMLNLLYCYAQLIEFAAFLHLRAHRPDLPRPFRIPLGTAAMSLLLVGPTCFIAGLVYYSSPAVLHLSLAMAALGVVAYGILHMARERKWCKFKDRFHEEPTPVSVTPLDTPSPSPHPSVHKYNTRNGCNGQGQV